MDTLVKDCLKLLVFHFSCVEGESILMLLDLQGICVSTGSACTSNSLEPSHVVSALGLCYEDVQGTICFSFSVNNTFEEIDFTIDALKKSVTKLRDMSPIYKKRKRVKKCIVKKIIEIFKNPQNVGYIKKPDAIGKSRKCTMR